MWPWRCLRCQRINRKNATSCAICSAHWTTGTRHSTEPKKSTNLDEDAGWSRWEEWSQKWDDTDASWEWDWQKSRQQSRSQSQSTTKSNKSNYAERADQRPKKQKGKGKGKGKPNKGQEKGQGSISPFAPLAMEATPWPTFESPVSNLMPSPAPPAPSSTPFSTAQSVENISQKKEVVNALKTAYPDAAQIPQETKEIIEKLEKDIERLEKENSKATTKNLHSATKALGRAQKTLTETMESKRVHRTRWTQHVAEAAKTWQEQLHQYRQQQAALQEIAAKARADIESARTAIQALSAKAPQETLAAMTQIAPVKAEAEEAPIDLDQEEEAVQQQLQTVLQSCAASLGIDVQQTPQTMAAEPMEEGEAEIAGTRPKRARALEPFAASATPSATPAV